MKIPAYINLLPEHISLDAAAGTVALQKSVRSAWNFPIYPTQEAAAAAVQEGYSTYAVSAEVTDGSVFEVTGSVDQTEDRQGSYTAGYFDNYAAAYAASARLGPMGQPGHVEIHLAPAQVYSTVEDWKADFDSSAARSTPRRRSFSMLQIVELDAKDPQAIGAADPEYVIWLKLNEKFAPKAAAV